MKIVKKESGVTLLALVITIVILMILTSITITTLKNNSILEKIQKSIEEHVIGEEKEEITLAWNDETVEYNGIVEKINSSGLEEKIKKYSKNEVTVEDGKEKNKDKFIIHFIKTDHYYLLDKYGNIAYEKNKPSTTSYKIKYVLNGGTNPESQPTEILEEQEVKILRATKENSYFGGWYENPDFSGESIYTLKKH